MDVKKIVNIFCMIAGVAVTLFGITVKLGAIEGVQPARGITPIVLGIIIIVWALISMKRASKQ